MMKKKVLLLFSAASPSSLPTIRAISEIRSFSYIVPSSLSNNQSPPPPRVYRFYMCPSFVQLVKFVVFQIHSPPSEGSGEVPSAPSPAPSPSLSTIRDIREIRSLSNKVPSSLSNNQSPPPYRVYRFCMCSPFVQLVKFVVFQIHSPPSEGSGEVPSTLSSVSSLYVFTIGAISEIRSLVSISAF